MARKRGLSITTRDLYVQDYPIGINDEAPFNQLEFAFGSLNELNRKIRRFHAQEKTHNRANRGGRGKIESPPRRKKNAGA